MAVERTSNSSPERIPEHLNLAAEAAGIGFWDWDPASGELAADARCQDLYHLAASAPARTQLARLVHPDDLPGVEQAISGLLASGDRIHHRCRTPRTEPSVKWVDLYLKVSRDASGQATRLAAMVSDVTAQVERTEQLEAQLAKERALVERLSVATQAAGIYVWEFDWATNVLRFDERRLDGPAKRHAGAELGADLFRWVHPDDSRIGAAATVAALARGERDTSFRYRLKLPDGSIRHIQAYARTTTDAAGRPRHSLGVSWDITAEVAAAEELASRAATERKLLDRLSVAIQAAGLSCWEFSYGSNKFTWMDGLPPAYQGREISIEEANTILSHALVPEDAERVRKETLQALEAGAASLSSRCRRVSRDGKIQHVRIYQRFVRDASGRPLRALGATCDVTAEVEAAERLKAQAEQLHEAQRRLERASFSVQQGHWELDWATRKHWASSNCYALLGYEPGEIDVSSLDAVRAIVHPEDSRRGMELLRSHVEHGTPLDFELRTRCKDGAYHWFRLRGSAERDEQGTVLRISGSIQDIEKQKLAEDALREVQARYERAINGTADGLWEVDLALQKMWLSPRLHELLGFRVGELGDHRTVLRERVHPDDLPMFDEAVRRNIAGIAPIDIEVRMRTKSDDYRWFRLRGALDPNSPPGMRRASGSMQDVTDAREARDALIRASEAAQAANRAKSAFLANVSHEIRTPMNGIIGMTTLLLDTPLDRTQRDYADTIRASADSLLTVINDILDFSKIEAGKLDIESIEMDLPACVEDIGATMAFQAAVKGLELIIDVHPDVPARVMGDPQRIRQCLVNLLGNAIKFTRTGEIAAEVSVRAREGDRVITRFEVRDTGIGIAPEKIKSLFEPFVQADSSTTRHFGGTGLGLSIVKRLVEMMGGEVGAQSALGKGATFWFELPMQPIDAAAPAEELVSRRKGRRVLVVDDNDTNRRVLVRHLAHGGFEVTPAAGAREALAIMQAAVQNRRPFDVVLADLQMPNMDGAMLGERINSDPQLAHARVVLLTSMDRHGDLRRFAAMGFAGYLTKPVKARELLMCLDKVLVHEAHDWHLQTHPIVTSNAVHQHATRRYAGNVLLVEDNPINQKVARRFLERLGCTVTLAENGVECIRAWERGQFALVLMDVQMPVMDGYTATREIRDRERGRRRTPIVALTANAMAGQLERCLETGMDGLLTKPLATEQLEEVLERYGLAVEGEVPLTEAAVANFVTTPSGSQPVDFTYLRELAGDDAGFIKSVAESFANSSGQLLAALRAGVSTGDAAQMARAAHQLKGASANLHAEALRELSAELEAHVSRLTRPDLEARITKLAQEVERVCKALNGFAADAATRAVG
ncbi:MAG: PAS domain-containing protein [Steroidobacteraceae bacterium]|nr:PAS domain-containing protein [Steroidobacteraceae bacterium]